MWCWHGRGRMGRAWSKIIPLLQAAGLNGAAQNPLNSIADDVASTNRVIDAQDGPVLLAGAFVWRGGDYGSGCESGRWPGWCMWRRLRWKWARRCGIGGGFPPPPGFGEIKPIADGYLLLTHKGVTEEFAQDLPAAETEVMLRDCAPTQGAILGTPIKAAAWHMKPSWFVIASELDDRAEQEISTAKRMGSKTLTVATSHVPMLLEPQKVAEFIIEAAGSIGAEKTAAAGQ